MSSASHPRPVRPVRRVREDLSVVCHHEGCPAAASHSVWDEANWPSRYLGDACPYHATQDAARGERVSLRRIA